MITTIPKPKIIAATAIRSLGVGDGVGTANLLENKRPNITGPGLNAIALIPRAESNSTPETGESAARD